MFINQEKDKQLQERVFQLNWANYCDDPQKYSADDTYKGQVMTDWYNKLSDEIENYKNKIISPFISHGFYDIVADRPIWSCYDYPDEVCDLDFKIVYSTNEKTNPFQLNVRIKVKKDDNTNTIKYDWFIEDPCRIYHRRSLNWGDKVCCNGQLFTKRGFTKIGYQKYKWYSSLEEWCDVNGKSKEICNKLKLTINKLKAEHEKIQKEVALKKSELSIQSDEVSCMLSSINAKIKDTNVKILFNGNCTFDYIDSPIRFSLIMTNNPEQDDENLYIDKGKEIYVGEFPCDCTPEQAIQRDEEINKLKPKLFTDLFGSSSSYYRTHTSYTLVYRPKETYRWNLQLNYPCSDNIFKCIMNIKLNEVFTTLDDVEEYLINLFKKDYSLYQKIEEWKNEFN